MFVFDVMRRLMPEMRGLLCSLVLTAAHKKLAQSSKYIISFDKFAYFLVEVVTKSRPNSLVFIILSGDLPIFLLHFWKDLAQLRSGSAVS